MDSDSGEQSEGEPVTAAGTEGPRQPGWEDWDWRGAETGAENLECFSELRDGRPIPVAGSLAGQGWGLLGALSLLWASSTIPLHLGRREGEEVHLRMAFSAVGPPRRARVAGAGWGRGRV